MQTARLLDIEFAFKQIGKPPGADVSQFIWAHGWMQSHSALLPLAQSLDRVGSHLLIDFPGFGASPKPPDVWGTRDYADNIAVWLKSFLCRKRIWVGHSFGCRVGIQLAAHYPQLIDGLFLIAAPGLPTDLTWKKYKIKMKIYAYKGLKRLVPLGLNKQWLINRLGSQDYQNSGMLRPVFIKVVSEDLTEVASRIQCPVHLVYGEQDTEALPAIGQRYSELIQNASFHLLPRYNHYNILTAGRHQVLHQLKEFMGRV